jgi:hypothetical protein
MLPLLSADAFLEQLGMLIDVLIKHPVRKCPEHVDVRPVKQQIAAGLDDCAVQRPAHLPASREITQTQRTCALNQQTAQSVELGVM